MRAITGCHYNGASAGDEPRILFFCLLRKVIVARLSGYAMPKGNTHAALGLTTKS